MKSFSLRNKSRNFVLGFFLQVVTGMLPDVKALCQPGTHKVTLYSRYQLVWLLLQTWHWARPHVFWCWVDLDPDGLGLGLGTMWCAPVRNAWIPCWQGQSRTDPTTPLWIDPPRTRQLFWGRDKNGPGDWPTGVFPPPQLPREVTLFVSGFQQQQQARESHCFSSTQQKLKEFYLFIFCSISSKCATNVQ